MNSMYWYFYVTWSIKNIYFSMKYDLRKKLKGSIIITDNYIKIDYDHYKIVQ